MKAERAIELIAIIRQAKYNVQSNENDMWRGMGTKRADIIRHKMLIAGKEELKRMMIQAKAELKKAKIKID